MSMHDPRLSKNLAAAQGGLAPAAVPVGNFTDGTGEFRSLFDDPDARGAQKWGEMFDTTRCDELDIDDLLRVMPKI